MKVHEVMAHFCMSRSTLQRHKEMGLFKKGIHYIKIGTGPKSDVIWDVDAMEKTMTEW